MTSIRATSGKLFARLDADNPDGRCTEDLILQLIEIVDKIDINQVGMKAKLEKDIEKYSHFRSKVLGQTEEERIYQNRLDIRAYMKHMLERGTTDEKRELMQSFTSRLILINKRVVVE